MDESWLAVNDAAQELGISARHARELLDSGALVGRKVGQSWLVDPQDVQRRAARSKQPGRPLSPNNAWRCLVVFDLAAQGSAAAQWEEAARISELSPVDRSRLRALLVDVPGPDGFARLVKSRADIRRVRVHPGLMDRALHDDAVSVGGGDAVASLGGGVAAGGRRRVYIPDQNVDDYVRRYRLLDDVEGNIDLAVIRAGVDPRLLPKPGAPVPLSVAWADLLDDPDSRARSAARDWVSALPRPLVISDGRRR